MAAEEPQHIYEARVEKMVSIKGGKPKWRLARFLLPIADNINESAAGIPHTPLLSDLFPHHLDQWPLKVVCKGWNWNLNYSHQKWKEWVHRLAPKYQTLWTQIGIRDAIFSSTYELRYNQEILLGLIEFWCSGTNTFVFPWGEASVTLEDVMILGVYPVVGEVVNCDLVLDLDLDLEGTVQWLENCRVDLLKVMKMKKSAEHAAWLKHFMEEETGDYEHVAFLSFWLSRYVFPSRSGDVFDNLVFPIAAKLSLGIKVALGPAVLANLYHKLRQVRDAFDSSMDKPVVISGYFQLLQVWAFERFPALVLGSRNPLTIVGPGEPRIAHWHKVNLKLNIPLVRSALRLAENFVCRPYSADLKNWQYQSFYKENEQLIFDCLSLDEELVSYVRCIRVSELVGTDGCREKYLPNRVAMQFGMDQDLPAAAEVLNFNSKREIVSIFIPSRTFQSAVSLRYSNWWKASMIAREVALKDGLSQTRNSTDSRTPVVQVDEIDEECGEVEYGMPEHPNNSSWASTKDSDNDSPSSFMLNSPFKTNRRVSSDSIAKKTDSSSSSSVRESVGKEMFSARDAENLQEDAFFESLNHFTGEWATVAGSGPRNPIDVDEEPDSPTIDSDTNLEGRIIKLEKTLGVK